ncbi:hypothetical protein AB0E56_16230 [Microbacterium sp. NPDC028030]|uniref:hypothetical protein n=1 Tax=Microbacterium sp. NPDC028030 TaxID=3155124 RepID=UPI0033E26AF1
MTVEYLATVVSGMWLTVAILAGGFARTRNRSAWAWFLLTLLFGPFAAFLLVVWPPVTRIPAASRPGHSGTVYPDVSR